MGVCPSGPCPSMARPRVPLFQGPASGEGRPPPPRADRRRPPRAGDDGGGGERAPTARGNPPPAWIHASFSPPPPWASADSTPLAVASESLCPACTARGRGSQRGAEVWVEKRARGASVVAWMATSCVCSPSAAAAPPCQCTHTTTKCVQRGPYLAAFLSRAAQPRSRAAAAPSR